MDFVLENADPRLVAAFRDTTRQLACRGSLVFPVVVARIKEAARVEAAADDQRPRGGAGIVGVVRVDSPQTLKLVASRDQDEVNLETVMDARFILVDGAGRPRRLSDAQLAAATEEIVATMLAYYAVLLARHHRIVRSARASAALAVEADDADRESPAVPSRIWLPGPA